MEGNLVSMLKRLQKIGVRATDRLSYDWELIIRLVLAAVITYTFIAITRPGTSDLTGTLAALLVVQASVYSTIRIAFERVLAVLCGVGIAIIIGQYFGINVISIGLTIFLSLVLATILDFKDNKIEVPISGLLILSASQQNVASESRILNTLIGTIIGLIAVFVFPLKPKMDEVLEAVNEVAIKTADSVEQIADEVDKNSTKVKKKLSITSSFRSLLPETATARDEIKDLRKSYLMNISPGDYAKNHRIDLMAVINSLEKTIVLLQKILITLELQSELPDESRVAEDVREDIRLIYSNIMKNASYAIRAFGEAVKNESEMDDISSATYMNFINAIKHLRGSRDMLTDMVTIKNMPDVSVAFIMATLKSVDSILYELNVNDFAEYQVNTKNIVKNKLKSNTVISRSYLVARENKNNVTTFFRKVNRKNNNN